MFGSFELIFPLFFLIVGGVFVCVFVSGISIWIRNNNSPRLTADAYIVEKREDVTHHNHTVGKNLSGA